MYDRLPRKFHWHDMATDVKCIVSKCQSCAQYNPTFRHKRNLQLFPEEGAFEFMGMNILRPFPKTMQHNQYIFVITDH